MLNGTLRAEPCGKPVAAKGWAVVVSTACRNRTCAYGFGDRRSATELTQLGVRVRRMVLVWMRGIRSVLRWVAPGVDGHARCPSPLGDAPIQVRPLLGLEAPAGVEPASSPHGGCGALWPLSYGAVPGVEVPGTKIAGRIGDPALRWGNTSSLDLTHYLVLSGFATYPGRVSCQALSTSWGW